jgi:cytoskeleton protein RodZ
MDSVGSRLKKTRQQQNRTISEIAAETRIGSRYLEAMERDDLSPFPGIFFYRNWTKQYAASLHIEDAELLAGIDRAATEPEVDVLPALSQAYTPHRSVRPSSRFGRQAAALVLIAVTAGGSAVYAWWHRTQETNEVPIAAAPATPSTVAAPSALPTDPAPTSAETTTATVQTESSAPTANGAPAFSSPAASSHEAAPEVVSANNTHASSGATLQVSARENTWVSISSGGRTVFSGTLGPGETKLVETSGEAKLLTGNAAGVTVRWNGTELPTLGPAGQVRVVRLSPGSYAVLPLRSKS